MFESDKDLKQAAVDAAVRAGRRMLETHRDLGHPVNVDYVINGDVKLIDALADLRHTADALKVDFAEAYRIAMDHYKEERILWIEVFERYNGEV